MKTYKLRNMPDVIHTLLKKKQKEMYEQTKRFYSLERVIYMIIKEK